MRKAGCQIIHSAGSREKAGTQRKRRRRRCLRVHGGSAVRGQGADPAPPSALAQPLTHGPLPRGRPERSTQPLTLGLSLEPCLSIAWGHSPHTQNLGLFTCKGAQWRPPHRGAVVTLSSDSAWSGQSGQWRNRVARTPLLSHFRSLLPSPVIYLVL